MNWKQSLFKPKWQHKDAAIRLAAVNTEQDPQLIGSLLEIAACDDDARVRCAAIRRLHQLKNILRLYDKETDAGTRVLLEDRIRQLSVSTAASRPPLEVRLQVVAHTTDKKLLEQLASQAPEAELRRAALAKVERQGLLGDCCMQDSDPENRRLAAGRITQQTTLKRVIKGLRKRDKSLYTQLQQRLHAALLEQADPAAVHSEAVNICAALEHLALATGDQDRGATATLYAAWARIKKMAAADMADRYQRVRERLEAPAPMPTPEREAKPRQEAPPQETPPQETLPQKPADTTRDAPPAGAERSAAARQRQAALDEQQRQLEQALSGAQALLTELERELEQGELHKALATRARIQQAGKGHGKHKGWQQLNQKMAGMLGRLRELREWQHWSNDKIRKRLIAEMQVLPAAGLHPDALLDRVKSLQAEWKALELSEQIPGDKHFASAPWMWRKFNAAGHLAFDTAKPYLEKRSEIQSRHAQSLAIFCAELEQLATASPTDWTALSKASNRGRKKLQDLNSVPAKQRQAFARQLKAALDKANTAMQQHYQSVEKEKMKLIRSASQLLHLPERSEAIAQAKSLQANWQAAGSLWRSREQALWTQFREHLDPLFDELKQQQETTRVALQEKLAAQTALCEDLQAILARQDDLSSQHGIVLGLRAAWKDIEHPDRKLLATFQALVAEYQQREKRAQQAQANADRKRWWLKSALLHELAVGAGTATGTLSKKTLVKVEKDWPEDSSGDALEIKMDDICGQFLAGGTPGPAADSTEDLTARARMLCIRLEFVAGLASPEDDRELRMRYQVERLAESMAGGSARLPATDEAHAAEKTWLGMYALPEAEFEAYGKRIRQALTAIMEE